jgi:hypothetical protein
MIIKTRKERGTIGQPSEGGWLLARNKRGGGREAKLHKMRSRFCFKYIHQLLLWFLDFCSNMGSRCDRSADGLLHWRRALGKGSFPFLEENDAAVFQSPVSVE